MQVAAPYVIASDELPRTLVLTLDFLPSLGGVQNYLAEISRRLPASWSVLAPATPGDVATDRALPFLVHRVPRLNAWSALRALSALQPEVVLCGHAHPQLLLPAWLYARSRGKRWGVFVHGSDVLAAQTRWHRVGFNALLARADLLFTNSEYTRERLLVLGVPVQHATLVRPGVDPLQFQPAIADVTVPGRILTVGRLTPRKGHQRVIRVLHRVRAQCPAAHCVIVGEGEEGLRLRALAAELGVGEAVTFVGSVPLEALVEHYQRCQVFAMPSQADEAGSVEGFGIVFLEASACAKPCLGTRSGGVAEAVRDGETGLLIPPDDPEALAAALVQLLTDAELRQCLGAAGRAWVEREMHWERAARQVADALRAV